MTNKIETPEDRFVNKEYENTKSDMITITEVILENILLKYLTKFKQSHSWLTSLTLVITMLIVILTADFNKDFLNIKKETWSNLFYIGFFVSTIWFISGVYYALKNRNGLKIGNLLQSIKISRYATEDNSTSQSE
jgi:uncharacterized membrane protein (DUF485 family)